MLTKSVLAAACVATAAAALFIAAADAAGDLVKFPADYMSGVHYGTVRRGNIREELFYGCGDDRPW
jgi:class 3 adenylate cyclase